ncbi:LysR family transcriptional regulator [Achromobacter aloeverae]|uniref:LysR family transcriptional regulator n=2 Tax=Achromobacter aloeverae TaxID=1750518 RepID=A0A4Q1HL40_9BURK|nr:LysR substrate-binding domain-containing protein [Achromobacter aloeverae]RXN90613.1 LysR family transcriptional regulator [Achromobacter aloeverae]
MELRHLRYFEALAQTLSFTKAAERVHVTQSTLSHQIRQLEEELGQALFDRIGKRVSMTEAGETLLLNIGPALRQVDAAVHAIRDSTQAVSGEIRIGTTQSFNIRLVPNCIAEFLARYPSVRLAVEELPALQIIEQLQAGSLDLGISYRPDAPAHDLWFEQLYTEEMRLVVSANHPLAHRRRIRMTELHGARIAVFSRQFSTRQLIDDCLQAAGAEPIIIAELNSINAMLELARCTDIAVIIGASADTGDSGLRFLPLEDPTPQRTPGLLWQRGIPRSMSVKYFATVIRRAVAKGKVDGP